MLILLFYDPTDLKLGQNDLGAHSSPTTHSGNPVRYGDAFVLVATAVVVNYLLTSLLL